MDKGKAHLLCLLRPVVFIWTRDTRAVDQLSRREVDPPLPFSCPLPGCLPFDLQAFYPKSCMTWGLARGGRVWEPAGKGDGERRKIKGRKAAGTHLLGTGQGGPDPGKSACLLSAVTQAPPSLLCSLCDTGLSPLVAAANRRCSRCPGRCGDMLPGCKELLAKRERRPSKCQHCKSEN